MKKKDKRKYPFPRPDEKRNRELRDQRIISAAIKTEAPMNARDIGSTQSMYNRRVENEARKAFQEVNKLEEQLQFIEALPALKERMKANIKATVKSLSSKPVHKWTVQETEAYEGLNSKLRQFIDKKHKRKHGI